MENNIGAISLEERVAIAEVDYIIHHMNELYLNKIPQKIRDYITILKKRDVKIYVDPHIPLEQQGLKEFTLYFLMILNLKYWCDDQRRKDILAIMEKNQQEYDKKMESVNNIFEQAESIKTVSGVEEDIADNKPRKVTIINPEEVKKTNENKEMLEEKEESEIPKEKSVILVKKENLFTKLINKIKSVIKKN